MKTDSILIYKDDEGRPVFLSTTAPKCEAAISLRIRELRELEKAAEDNGVITQCIQCSRYGHGCKGASNDIYTGCALRI